MAQVIKINKTPTPQLPTPRKKHAKIEVIVVVVILCVFTLAIGSIPIKKSTEMQMPSITVTEENGNYTVAPVVDLMTGKYPELWGGMSSAMTQICWDLEDKQNANKIVVNWSEDKTFDKTKTFYRLTYNRDAQQLVYDSSKQHIVKENVTRIMLENESHKNPAFVQDL